MLDMELTVIDGKYKGRKFWEYMVVDGTTSFTPRLPTSPAAY